MNDPSEDPGSGQNLRDYVRVIFRQKFVILLSVIVIMTIVIFGLALSTPMYEASVKMLISGVTQLDSPDYREMMTIQDSEVSMTQSEIVTSAPVLRCVVDAMHLYDRPFDYESKYASPLKRGLISLQAKVNAKQMERLPKPERSIYNYQKAIEELRGNIKVEPIKETNIFTINVKDYDPITASVLANMVSRSYVIFDLEQQLAELQQKYGDKHPMYLQLRDHIKDMTALLAQRSITNDEALGSENVKIIEQASIPFMPKGLNNNLIELAALFASIFVGLILAFLFEYMDQTIKSVSDVEKVLGVPLVGTVPNVRSITGRLLKDVKKIPKHHHMVFQNLANQLRLMMTIKSFKTVVVTAAGAREGTSAVVANLGVYAAQGGAKKVLIIDANFYHPVMPKFFYIPDSPGLVDVLTQQASLEDAIQSSVQPSLFILPAGKTTLNPLIFLDSPKTRQLLEKLKSQFDLVLIDCVNLNFSQEACLLASCVDKTIFVVSENQTRRPVALKALVILKEHNASILGVILNKRTYPIPKFLYERV